MQLRSLSVIVSVFLFAVVAHAQAVVAISVQPGQRVETGGDAGGIVVSSGHAVVVRQVGSVGGITTASFTSAGNTGLPFSADVVEENDKFLADGNHIHFEVHGKFFRDSEGRMRTETEAPVFTPDSKPFVHINITDLVEGRIIFIDMEHKTATVTHLGQPPSQAAIARSKPLGGNNPKVRSGPAGNTVQRSTPPTHDPAPEDLGATQIEGFAVMGTRSTHIMEAGVIGNDKPIATTTERWFSTDLKMDLVNITESPDSGKHVRKLVNIRSGEPDPLLFQVPPDFALKEMPQP